MKDFSDLFYVYRKDRLEIARQYVTGLMQLTERKNMEQISHVVPDSNHQALQQFITDSTWDAAAVMDRVAENVNDLLGDSEETCLIIDESCFSKKGSKSVGVARQWSGNTGKIDNCQAGVFSALSRGNKYGIINARLYLPHEWTENKGRCEEAKIPLSDREFKTKDEIAFDLIKTADMQGLKYGWICADAGYGKGYQFCEALHKRAKRFLVDIHSDLMVYQTPINPYIPQDTIGARGRKHKRYVTDSKAVRVDELIKKVPDAKWRTITIRNSTKGDLQYEFYTERVNVWPDKGKEVYSWELIVRRNKDKSDYKYSLSNAAKGTSTKKLALIQSQRFWIERAFEDYKSHCGMAEYEVRSWHGWHHHMALVMMAGLFVLKEKLQCEEIEKCALTCSDIEYLLQQFLPKRIVTDDEIYAELYRRIKFRELLYSQ